MRNCSERRKKRRKKQRKIILDKEKICGRITNADAGVAHLVERHLAKVEVASSSLVARSRMKPIACAIGFLIMRVWRNWQTRWI